MCLNGASGGFQLPVIASAVSPVSTFPSTNLSSTTGSFGSPSRSLTVVEPFLILLGTALVNSTG